MKIRWYDRLTLVVVSLFLLTLSVCIAMLALGFARDAFYFWSDQMLTQMVNRVMLWGIAVLLLICSLRLLLLRSKKDSSRQDMIFMCTTDSGSIRILPEAVDAIVQRAAKSNQSIRDLKTKIIPVDETLHIQLRVMIAPGVLVKETTLELQRVIKEELEKNTGIPVPEVQVIVEATPGAQIARVE